MLEMTLISTERFSFLEDVWLTKYMQYLQYTQLIGKKKKKKVSIFIFWGVFLPVSKAKQQRIWQLATALALETEREKGYRVGSVRYEF